MEVAAADAADRHRDARPRRSGQVRLGNVRERRGKRGIGIVELHGAHGRSVRVQCRPVRVPDAAVDELRERGFVIVEDFLTPKELAAAQAALWKHFPAPDDYFADPARYAHYESSQFAGVEEFPYRSWDLNRLAFHPDLVDLAERFLGTAELHLYKVELWAKYAGAIDYDQPLHRDYGSHSLVVPRRDGRYQQLTTFIYLSDVTELDAPTRIVPYDVCNDIPFTPLYGDFGAVVDSEVAAVGSAGSAARVPHGHLAPRLELRRTGPDPLLATRRLPSTRHDVGGQDVVAEAVPGALGQAHPAVHRARTRPVRLSPARRRVLERADVDRRRGALSRNRHDPVPRGGEMTDGMTQLQDRWMGDALAEARVAATEGDVPVGAIVVDLRRGEIVARAHNRRELDCDPSAHAEVLALRAAGARPGRGGWLTMPSSSRSNRARCAPARRGRHESHRSCSAPPTPKRVRAEASTTSRRIRG